MSNTCGADTVTISLVASGMEQINPDDVIAVYPNPATQQVFVKFPESISKVEYVLYNNLGHVVGTGSVEGKQSISIAHLVSGYYVMRIITNEGAVTKSLLIDNN